MENDARRKQVLYLELAKLLEAGFGIRQAIGVVLETKPPAWQVSVLRKTDAGLADGKRIAEAFGENDAVTDLERSIVAAGERGGRMGQAFRHLADYFELLADARREMGRAMIYPAVLLHMGVLLAVVPGGLMAGRTPGEVFVSALVALAGLYAGLFVAWVLIRMLLKAAPSNAGIDRWLNRLPVIGKARRNMAMARFTKVYHTGVLAGLSMKETVANSLAATQSGSIREGGRALLAKAEEGGALGPVFVEADVFPKIFARSYATAEEAGGLDKDLERWSKVYQDEAARGVKAVAVAVPKVLYFLILIFVAWKIIGFYSGYYEMIDKIGE